MSSPCTTDPRRARARLRVSVCGRAASALATLAVVLRLAVVALAVVVHAGATATPAAAVDRLAQALPGNGAKAAAPVAARAEPTPEPRGPADDFQRGTPRSSLRGFLAAARQGEWTRAAEYLDLRRIRPADRAFAGPELARQLYVVLERTLWVDLNDVAADPTGAADDGLTRDQDLVGTIQSRNAPVDVLLARVPRGDGERIWKIAAPTLDSVPALYEEFGYGRLGEILPRPFFELDFLGIQLWQWLGLIALVGIAFVVTWLATVAIVRVATPILQRTGGPVDARMVQHVLTPIRLVAAVALFSALRQALALAKRVDVVLGAIETALLIVAFTWIVLRAVDAVGDRIAGRLASRGQFGVMPLVRPARRGVKLLVVLLAGIVALDNLGFNVTALVAGLGVGGIAVALAAQKSLENLFAAITLFGDQPIRVGNFCGFDGRVGTVEEIGLRSTRVRTLDRTVVAIPNAEFAGMQLENYDERDKMLFRPKLQLRYDTSPDQIRWILVEVRRMLYAHPRVDADPARIRFTGFGASSLDLEVFAYVATRDFGEYLEIAEDLNLRIMDIVAAAGTAFAVPAQTAFVESGRGVDRARADAVEGEVRGWRERGELFLPSFPHEQVCKIADTLDYPPAGSAAADAANGGRRT